MKKYILLLPLLCIALSCGQGFSPADRPVVFTAGGSSASVRAGFTDDLSALCWETGDRIGIYAFNGSETVGINYPYEATEISGASATLSAVSSQWQYGRASVAGCTFQAYAPFSGVAGDGNRFVVPISIPSEQAQEAAGSTGHLAAYTVLKSFPATADAATGAVNLRFRNLSTVVELEIKATAASHLRLVSASLEGEAPLAFDRGSLLLEGAPDDAGGCLQVNDASNSVTLTLTHPAALTTAGVKFYFTLMPGTHAAGTLKLLLTTIDGYTATVDLPSAVTFAGNGIYRKSLSVNPSAFAPAEGVSYIWKKVTASEAVTTGQYVVSYLYDDGTHTGTLLLPCAQVDRNPLPADISTLGLSFNPEGDLTDAPVGYVWDVAKTSEGWSFSCVNDAGTCCLGACDQGQGVTVDIDGKGYYYYHGGKEYSTLWTLTDTPSGIRMTVPVSERKAMPWIDPANGLDHFEWRMTKSETGGYVFYKKTQVEQAE